MIVLVEPVSSQAIGLHVGLLASVGNAPQLPFSGKFLVKHFKLVDELLAHRGEDVARGYRAVCLHTDEELRHVGVAN